MATLRAVKQRVSALSAGLPKKTLADGAQSQVTIVPFYDRSELIGETIGGLRHTLTLEILVTGLVSLLMMGHLRGALLIAATPPLATLLTFLVMDGVGLTANVVALSGIAIAIGTMVDTAIVMVERVVSRLREAGPEAERPLVILRACQEVVGALLTAVATTVVGFLPVLALQEAEGKLFQPLAWTKTFALLASIGMAVADYPSLVVAPFGLRPGTVRPMRRWSLSGSWLAVPPNRKESGRERV